MNKRFYIFDLDGTLCDSMGLWRAETEHIENFRDPGLMEPAYRKMRVHYRNEVKLKDGVREFLENARAAGVKMCIATGTRRDVAEPFLEKTGIMEFMEFFIDCHEIGRFKEHPDIYLQSAERLGAAIEDCAVFEDSEYSAETAKNAGFYVVGIIDEVTGAEGDVRGFSDIAVKDWRELLLTRV
ncbi:MAG: HAD family hydrolase [Lachnospiraceae bacterium]|nr:HAD family hydrolase [Ruminococcus sp.]MCM1274893.1 HAD family hydrolase [Lachnospiraceae bacterium]